MKTLYDLVEYQRKLDETIINKHKLQGEDLYVDKKTALIVELCELANELRFFKFWSENQSPRWYGECDACEGVGTLIWNKDLVCAVCWGTGENKYSQPVLEEYVDCIHFMLSLCIDRFKGDEEKLKEILTQTNSVTHTSLSDQFNILIYKISGAFYTETNIVVGLILGLGEKLGFTIPKIIEAYLLKNDENFKRQEQGY